MATQETIKQLFSGGVLRDVEDVTARQAITSLQNALNALTSGDTTTAIENFQEVIDFLEGVTDDETLIGKITALQTAINGKQPMLTFDNAPTVGSNNPVKSGGVKTALDAKADSSSVYPKSQTYTKTEVDNAIDNALDGFTPADVPTKVSDLTNDAGYQTQQQVAAAINNAAIEAVVGNGDFVLTHDDVNHIYNLVRLVPTLTVTQLDAMSEDTKSGTFKVSGVNLKGDVTISTSAANWSLSVNGGTASQSLTLSQTDGVLTETTITVAYGGSTDSTGNVITVSSNGAESKTVTATYTEHAGPTITTSNDAISISEVGGYENTATLQITGVMLTGNITAALSSGSKFSLSKTTFVQSGGTVNETLTITYSPDAGDSGTQTDTLTLSSDGATPVTIQLTGTVLTQSLTLTPSSLTLESEAGQAASGTIKVEGNNVKGDVTVGVPTGFTATLNGSSVSTLTAAQVNATNGVTLTIGNAGTTASGNLTFSVGGTQLASASLEWQETETPPGKDDVVYKKYGYSDENAVVGTTIADIQIAFKVTAVATESSDGTVRIVREDGTEGYYPNAQNYTNLKKLRVPATISIANKTYKVTELAGGAFLNSGVVYAEFDTPNNVTAFLVSGGMPPFRGALSFKGTGTSDSINTFTYPSSITSTSDIGSGDFFGTQVRRVVVPDSVQGSLSNGWSVATHLDLGTGITSISHNNWYSINTSDFIFRKAGVVGINSYTASQWASGSIVRTIHVPSDYVSAYEADTNWKTVLDAGKLTVVTIMNN